jgi:hypothetical protein
MLERPMGALVFALDCRFPFGYVRAIDDVLVLRSIASALEPDCVIEHTELLIKFCSIDDVVVCFLVVLVLFVSWLFYFCEACFDPVIGFVIVDGCFWIGLILMK